MDPLSDVLYLLKLRHYFAGGFEAGGDWAIAFSRDAGIRFYSVLTGECWVSVEGVAEPMRIKTGQCILLPRGRAFRVGSNLSTPPIDAMFVLPRLLAGGISRLNDGDDFVSVGGVFTLSGEYGRELIRMLPPIILIDDQTAGSVMRWCSETMRQELDDEQPGGALMIQQLVTMLLIQAIRLHLAKRIATGTGWLFALSDKRLAAALRAMHQSPAHRWTLLSLAERAGMSRTSFAVEFKRVVGTSPMEYLTRWRMMVASDRLLMSDDSIALIAVSLGYESESAFGSAFKREMGCSPRQHARHGKAPSQPKAGGHDGPDSGEVTLPYQQVK